MKTVIILASVLFSFSLLASEEIFNALNVDAVKAYSVKNVLAYSKSVGGLNCTQIINKSNDEVIYTCETEVKTLNFKAIYDALMVEEENIEAPEGQIRFMKTAGKLNCLKAIDYTYGNSYLCNL